jgi:hypothetical protein
MDPEALLSDPGDLENLHEVLLLFGPAAVIPEIFIIGSASQPPP